MWYLGNVAIVEENHALAVNAILWTTLATIVMSLRLYTRAVIIRGLGLDDWLMLSALVRTSSALKQNINGVDSEDSR
jgi:hypothetical protein